MQLWRRITNDSKMRNRIVAAAKGSDSKKRSRIKGGNPIQRNRIYFKLFRQSFREEVLQFIIRGQAFNNQQKSKFPRTKHGVRLKAKYFLSPAEQIRVLANPQ